MSSLGELRLQLSVVEKQVTEATGIVSGIIDEHDAIVADLRNISDGSLRTEHTKIIQTIEVTNSELDANRINLIETYSKLGNLIMNL